MTQDLLNVNQDDTVQIDENKDYYKELTGEGGKFYDPDPEKAKQKIGRGKYESDQFIKTLTRQQDELRADYIKLKEESVARDKLEELIGQLEARQQNVSHESTLKVNEPITSPLLDPKQIESLIDSRITEKDLAKKQSDNFKIVEDRLKERYGKNYQSVLKEQTESLGLSGEDVNALARKSPVAFFTTFGLDQQQSNNSFQTPPKSSQRNDSFSPKAQKRLWSYYQTLKKEKPTVYWDPKTTVQMHKDAEEYGDAFFDTD